MSKESETVLRGDKCAEIIRCLSEMYGLTLEHATDIFYNSETSELIEARVADLHCRSPRYLAQCIWEDTHLNIS